MSRPRHLSAARWATPGSARQNPPPPQASPPFNILAALLPWQKVPSADLPSHSVPDKRVVIQCKSSLSQDPGGIKPPLLP